MFRKDLIFFSVAAIISLSLLIPIENDDICVSPSIDNIEYQFENKLNLNIPTEVSILANTDEIKILTVRELRKSFYQHSGTFIKFIGVVEAANPAFPIRLAGYPIIELKTLDSKGQWEWEKGHSYEITGLAVQYEKHKDYDSFGFNTLRVYIFDRKHLGEAE